MLKKKGTTPHGSSQNLSSTGGWENPIWTKPHQTSMVGFILTSLLGCVKMNPSAEASLSLPWWYSQKSCNISMYIQSQRNWHNTLYDERYCWWQAEISGDHQLRLVVYPPWFTRLKCIPGGCLGFLKHQPEHSSTSVRWEMDPGNRGDWNSKSQRLEELEGQFLSLGIQSPCQMMIGMYNPLLSKVFRFHYHSQKVIGSPGFNVFLLAKFNWSFPFESMFKSREVL